jgi:hypothetical protein
LFALKTTTLADPMMMNAPVLATCCRGCRPPPGDAGARASHGRAA